MSQALRLEPIPPPWFGEYLGMLDFVDGNYGGAIAHQGPVSYPAWDIMYVLASLGHLGEASKAREMRVQLAADGRELDWALGIGREPHADPEIRQRLHEGIRKALSF
jgi:hypothetical protein